MKRNYSLTSLIVALFALPASGQLLITQYYEGSASNKYIELTNVGSETIDMSTYTLTLWSNANNNESWKSDGGAPTSSSVLTGTLSAGASYVLANSSAASPLAADQADETSGAVNFNGNDSVVLYNGFVGDVADIADAIAVTTANEAANLSIVRKNIDTGFNTTLGSSFLDFADVWGILTNDEADAAVAGSDGFLGSSALGMSLPSLAVSVDPASFSEGAGSGAATGTVTRTGNTNAALVVTLTVSDDTEATVPATVTIPVGSASAEFMVDAVDDAEQDTDQTVQISVSADGFINGSTEITVQDDEAAIPTVELAVDMGSISENGGTATITATVSVASAEGYTFDLSSSDTGELTVPATLTIPATETTGTVQATAVDDLIADGSQVVTVTAVDSAANVVDATIQIVVTDDEDFVAPAIVINELRIDNEGFDDAEPDVNEYLEIYGATPDYSLDRVWLIVLGDAGAGSRFGNIDRAYDLTGRTAAGNYFVVGADPMVDPPADIAVGTNIFENGDSLTFLLVTDFTGTVGEDIDADDDGVLDSMPWGSVIDAVSSLQAAEALDGEGIGYAAAFGGMDITQEGAFPPAHLFRFPDGTGAFQIGPFGDDPEIPAIDSPGGVNTDGVTPVEPEEIIITKTSVSRTSGQVVLTAIGLGDFTYVVQSSTDLGQSDDWATVSGVTESDNGEAVDFSFNDAEAVSEPRNFYRLLKQ